MIFIVDAIVIGPHSQGSTRQVSGISKEARSSGPPGKCEGGVQLQGSAKEWRNYTNCSCKMNTLTHMADYISVVQVQDGIWPEVQLKVYT